MVVDRYTESVLTVIAANDPRATNPRNSARPQAPTAASRHPLSRRNRRARRTRVIDGHANKVILSKSRLRDRDIA